MAAVKKFGQKEASQQLRHIERRIQNPKNKDIDPERKDLNYSFIKDRGMTSYDYLLKRKEELHYRKQADLKLMAGWVVTAPDNLPLKEEDDFFQCVHEFLCERYGGEKNCIQSVVHKDEVSKDINVPLEKRGHHHLHFCFIPTVPDKKHGGFKISAKHCLDLKELRNFHPDLQQYLDSKNIHCTVYSGITKKQGGNRTVKEMKEERELEQELERGLEQELERELEQEHEHEIERFGW